MSTIHILSRSDLPMLLAEDFGHAVFCGGIVYPWRETVLSFYTDSRAWGYDIPVSAGAWVRTSWEEEAGFLLQKTDCTYTMSEPNSRIDVIYADETGLDCIRYRGRDAAEPEEEHYAPEDDFLCHLEGNAMVIDGYVGDPAQILIPAVLSGHPVCRVLLGDGFLPDMCETLLVSEGVRELDVRFDDNYRLRRLEVPDSVKLLSPPDKLAFTRWFRDQPRQPVYLCGWYCGTPGGGAGRNTELVIRDGTLGIAGVADFRCYWGRVHIPDSVTCIGDCAFAFAPCLEEVRLPENLSYLGAGAFQSCDRLQHLRLPDGLTAPVDAFGLCQCLREVSMPAACWTDAPSYFPACPTILLRDGGTERRVTRNTAPHPVTGTLCAYSQEGPLVAAGRIYSGMSKVVFKKMPGDGNYRDCFGNRVLHVRQQDKQLYTMDGGPYWEQRWYLMGPRGLTEILLDDLEHNYMVYDGIPLSEVPKRFRRRVEEVFFKDRPED